MPILIAFLTILILSSCKPEKDIPKNGMKIYKTILKFMDESSEPPNDVKKYIHDIMKDKKEKKTKKEKKK